MENTMLNNSRIYILIYSDRSQETTEAQLVH